MGLLRDRRRLGALWAALVLVALVLTGAAAPGARAARTPDVGSITIGATGSVSVHRLMGGVRLGAPGTVPVPGVAVTLTPLTGVDLRTTAGWETLAGHMRATTADLAGILDTANKRTATTGSNGTATFSNVPVGAYLVRETGGPSPAVNGYARAADTLVAVPSPDATRTSWDYDIDVYPKAASAVIDKSVADGNIGVPGQDAPVAGTVLTYELPATIPEGGLRAFGGHCTPKPGAGVDAAGFDAAGMCPAGATYTGVAAGAAYEIIDDLTTRHATVTRASPGGGTTTVEAGPVSDYLEYTSTDPAHSPFEGRVDVLLQAGTASPARRDPTSLTRLRTARALPLPAASAPQPLTICADGQSAGCDYTLTRSATRIHAAMTDSGIEKLQAARRSGPDAHVLLTVRARVRLGSGGADAPVNTATRLAPARLGDGLPAPVLNLPGEAVLIPTGAAKVNGQRAISSIVTTTYSSLRLRKYDLDTAAGIPGATFTLYRTRTDAAARRNPLAFSAPTDADGMTQLAGLHVNDFQNGSLRTPVTDAYWIVETEVPPGYFASQQPIEVRVHHDGVTAWADATGARAVANSRSAAPPEPQPTEPPPTVPPSTPSPTPLPSPTQPVSDDSDPRVDPPHQPPPRNPPTDSPKPDTSPPDGPSLAPPRWETPESTSPPRLPPHSPNGAPRPLDLLPYTGAEIWFGATIALALVIAGTVLLFVSRRDE